MVNGLFCRIVVAVRRVAVIVLAGLPAAAAAQETLTLERAVQTALERNPGLSAARAGAAEASARLTQARSGLFPRFSVAETWQRGDQPVFVFSSLLSARRFAASNFAIDALNHPDAVGFFRTSLVLDQIVFDGGRQRAAAAGAAFRRDMASASTAEASAAVAVSVTQTFGRIVTGEAAKRAAQAGLAAAREDLAHTERRRDVGMASDADVLTLVVHVADLQQRAIQAEGDAAVARAELNRLLGNDIAAEVHVLEPASPPAAEFTAESTLAALLAEADAARPELRRATAAQDAADASRRQARAALIPQIAAQGGVEFSGTGFTERASSWLIGGEFRWRFSSGGAELSERRAAAASLARAQAELGDARAAVHVEVVTALRRFETARARAAAGLAAVDQARESQRIVRDRFEAGIASVNDLLRASTAVLDADGNRVTALVDTIVARAALRRALGRTP